MFAETCKNLDIEIQPGFFPAASDSRYLRELDIPAIGFTPLINTVSSPSILTKKPVLFHDHDEFIYIDGYLKAIDIYVHMIQSLVGLIE
jgi:aminoacylase